MYMYMTQIQCHKLFMLVPRAAQSDPGGFWEC